MVKKETKKEEKFDAKKIDGFNQNIKVGTKMVALHTLINEDDCWQTGGRKKMTILTHDAVKKLADLAGVAKSYTNTILTQPDAYNNYQYTWQVEVCMVKDKNACAVGIGEANRNNLGAKGRGNPANMAEKRAYDRAVLRLLGITGLLSEEELPDDETDNKMDGLTHEERKTLAPVINKLLLATTKTHLIVFNKEMKGRVEEFTPNSLEYLRKLYKKRLAELQPSF